MNRYVIYALISMVFAGLMALAGKKSLEGISSDFSLLIRNVYLLLLTLLYCAFTVKRADLGTLTAPLAGWLFASAFCVFVSALFFYQALQGGNATTVGIIDKCSLVVTVVGAAFFLGEAFTWKTGLSVGLVLAGLLLAGLTDETKKEGGKSEPPAAQAVEPHPAEPQPVGAE